MSEVSAAELMRKYEITEEDCLEQVTDKHLDLISRSCCKEWKSLPSYLELETVVAEDISKSKGDEREKRHDFLLKWKEIKGSRATYKQLIQALVEIRCVQDAERVCKILRDSIALQPRQTSSSVTSSTASALPSPSCSGGDQPGTLPSLDPDTLMDLRLQLDMELQSIINQYGVYVRRIREALESNGVSANDLSSILLKVSAFSHTKQNRMLLSAHKEELENAVNLYKIFNLLAEEYASFLNCDIFQFIVDTYDIDHGQDVFKYPEHLKAYLEKHKVSEFLMINPQLESITSASKELVLKIDIESTSRLAKISDLKAAVAKILRLKSATLRLLSISEGCLVVTFLIPTPIAEFIFNKQTVLTEKQLQQFRGESVIRLECNDYIFSFAAAKVLKDTDHAAANQKEEFFAAAEVLETDYADQIEKDELHKRVPPRIPYNFISEPDDGLICVICMDVAEEPLQHVACGRLFCKACIEKQGKEKPCPHCRTEGSEFYPDRRSKRVILELGLKCVNVNNGCEWKGTVDTIEKHLTMCHPLSKPAVAMESMRQVKVHSDSEISMQTVRIVDQPCDVHVMIYQRAQLTCLARGEGELRYIWSKASTQDGRFHYYKTTALGVLPFDQVSIKDTGYYQCRVTDNMNRQALDSQVVQVKPLLHHHLGDWKSHPHIEVLRQPMSCEVHEGHPFHLVFDVECSTEDKLGYQWWFSLGYKINGANSHVYSREKTSTEDYGSYWCEVRAGSVVVLSKQARIKQDPSNHRTLLNEYCQKHGVSHRDKFIEDHSTGQAMFKCTITCLLNGSKIVQDSGQYYPKKDDAKEIAAHKILLKIKESESRSRGATGIGAATASNTANMLWKSQYYDKQGKAGLELKYKVAEVEGGSFVASIFIPELRREVKGEKRRSKKEAEHNAAMKAIQLLPK